MATSVPNSLANGHWKKHLLCRSAKNYCQLLDPNYVNSDGDIRAFTKLISFLYSGIPITISNPSLSLQDIDEEPSMIDRSGQLIQYELYSASPIIGAEAPKVADLMKGEPTRKRKTLPKKITKRSAIKASASATPGGSSSAAAGVSSSATAGGPSSVAIAQVI